jgi:trigger factor
MKVNINENSELETQVEIIVDKSDYKEDLNRELQKLRKNSNMRGFRKGKAPMSFIQKVHGLNLKVDLISKAAQNKLNELIKEKDMDLLDQPLMTESDLDEFQGNTKKEEAKFTFLLGKMPQLALAGLGTETTYDYYELSVSDDMINEQMDQIRKQLGESIEVEEDIQENDVISIQAFELEGEELKEKGWKTDFKIAVDLVADEQLKEEILTLKKGDKFRFDVFNLERERNEEYVRTYFLNLGEEETDKKIGNYFEGEITETRRVIPAEIDEEFFNKAFGGEVKTEEEAREKLSESFKQSYASISDNIFYDEVSEQLYQPDHINLPESYVDFVFKSSKNAGDKGEFVEAMQRQVFISNLIKKYSISVGDEEIRDYFKFQMMNYYGGMPMDDKYMMEITNRLMQNKEQVDQAFQSILSSKIIESIKNDVTRNIIELSKEDLMEKYESLKSKAQDHDHDHDHSEEEE